MGCASSKGKEHKVAPSCAVSAGEDIRDKYSIGKVLGSGSFGQVREAALREDAAERRAVKVIQRDNDSGEWSNTAIFKREIQLLQEIDHDNIIKYFDFYEDEYFLYVVMELCRGGEVFAKILEIKRFSEKDAARLGMQMLTAIQYLHKLWIVHRDIKAENFMLLDTTLDSPVKMIDFGMATKLKQKQVLTELCGSPHYLAPELIGQKYTHLVDIWAFGVLMYLLMYGQYPFDAKTPKEIMTKILTNTVAWNKGKAKLSKAAIEFLKKLLTHDPSKRLEANSALRDPWILLATSFGATEEQVISTQVLRSAHKKCTANKKTVDKQLEVMRNKRLAQLQEDFAKGIRHGHRIDSTAKEEFMSKPEFVRRDNKLTTAPGACGGNFQAVLPGKGEQAVPAIQEQPRQDRARRLSHLGLLTAKDEQHFATLFHDAVTKTNAEEAGGASDDAAE
mmetsp:Transcript_43604/g.79448  ORF Transcript_43604/g.79448 Transcript_43604/m.79448 type:complete len:448 (+) Transcript_43604:78-1421(+)